MVWLSAFRKNITASVLNRLSENGSSGSLERNPHTTIGAELHNCSAFWIESDVVKCLGTEQFEFSPIPLSSSH